MGYKVVFRRTRNGFKKRVRSKSRVPSNKRRRDNFNKAVEQAKEAQKKPVEKPAVTATAKVVEPVIFESDEESEIPKDPLQQLMATLGKAPEMKFWSEDAKQERPKEESSAAESNSDDEDIADDSSDGSGRSAELETADVDNNDVNTDVTMEPVTSVEEELNDDQPEEEDVDKADAENDANPFSRHFDRVLPAKLLKETEVAPDQWETREELWPKFGRISRKCLKTDVFPLDTHLDPIKEDETLEDLYVKRHICRTWAKANRRSVSADVMPNQPFTDLQRELFTVMNSYSDLVYCRRTHETEAEIRAAYCLHIVNHILKSNDRVMRNNALLGPDAVTQDCHRDQGMTRLKCLVLVPFRQAAVEFVRLLQDLVVTSQVRDIVNVQRFRKKFVECANRHKKKSKGQDFNSTFTGNLDDNFRLGISVTKRSLYLYSHFYDADIVVASPLGLRMLVGAAGDKHRDYDYLSSVEVLVIDQAEVLLMQNWEHVQHILNLVNCRSRQDHGTDFSRLRPYVLDGLTRHYRQTLCFSRVVCPEVNSVFSRFSCNYAGIVYAKELIAPSAIQQVILRLPHVFQRFEVSSFTELSKARFDFFLNSVLPQMREARTTRNVIFIPSYFDYVRIRNHFRKIKLDFTQVCEYTRQQRMVAARRSFIKDEVHLLLYTERAHFFNRLRLHEAWHVFFYELPLFPHFYSGLCNDLSTEKVQTIELMQQVLSCSVLFSKYDFQRLAAVVGVDRASHMITSEKDVFMFETGV